MLSASTTIHLDPENSIFALFNRIKYIFKNNWIFIINSQKILDRQIPELLHINTQMKSPFVNRNKQEVSHMPPINKNKQTRNTT